jgi:hypothetical protein
VLISSIGWIRFESTVEDDQEFSHGCSQSEFGRFTGSTQPQIEGAQDWIVSRGD